MKRETKTKGVLSCLLALVLALSITPSVFAEESVGGTTIYVDAMNGDDTQEGVGTTSDTAYKTVAAAVAAAESGDTIQLSEGNYTLYGVSSEGHTKGKDLTFVGQGTDQTGWNIGAEVPDPANFGTEYNGDYSFDGAKTSVYKGYKQDKIEMRGDRAEMSDFPLYLNTVAGGLDRRDQTIGGFSFVVKIYAVPVVEIIG